MTKTELKKNITKINKLLRSDSYEAGIELIKTLDNPEIKKGTLKAVITRIKTLLTHRIIINQYGGYNSPDTYQVIDAGVRIARNLDEPSVYETLLEGCSDENGFNRNKLFTGTGPAQPCLDYALWNLIGYAPENSKIHNSLKREKITGIKLGSSTFTEIPKVISKFPNLSFLDISNNEFLKNVDGLSSLENLNWINIHMGYRTCLENINGLVNSKKLNRLNLEDCSALQNIDVLVNCEELTELNLRNCNSLQNVDGLKNCTQLTDLDLGYSETLQNVDGLKNCTQLTSLDLFSCPNLLNLDGLKNCTQLTSLDLRLCSSLQKADGLRNLPNLTSLNMNNCKEIYPEPSKKEMTTFEEVAAYQEEIRKSMK